MNRRAQERSQALTKEKESKKESDQLVSTLTEKKKRHSANDSLMSSSMNTTSMNSPNESGFLNTSGFLNSTITSVRGARIVDGNDMLNTSVMQNLESAAINRAQSSRGYSRSGRKNFSGNSGGNTSGNMNSSLNHTMSNNTTLDETMILSQRSPQRSSGGQYDSILGRLGESRRRGSSVGGGIVGVSNGSGNAAGNNNNTKVNSSLLGASLLGNSFLTSPRGARDASPNVANNHNTSNINSILNTSGNATNRSQKSTNNSSNLAQVLRSGYQSPTRPPNSNIPIPTKTGERISSKSPFERKEKYLQPPVMASRGEPVAAREERGNGVRRN